MRVLIASHSLGSIGGVQTYERDLALWLLERGHSPVVYSTVLGETARHLERLTVPFTDDLTSVAAVPDVIHGDAAVETMIALLHFPSTPALFVCHGWRGVIATPPRFPRLLRYVAVDDTCADRLLLREGIPAGKVSVLLNAVDIDRFPQREPLPERPKRAIVFSNAAHELTHLPIVREACRRASIEVDVIGELSDTPMNDPESVLGRYDLAFAKAKCAIEAMACGLAVILCDSSGSGGMVRSIEVDRLRRLNFGARSLSQPLSADALFDEIGRYDRDDARKVSDRIRATAASDALHESLFAMYGEIVEEHARRASEPDRDAESRAVAAFFHRITKAEREGQSNFTSVVQAAQRVLATPIAGPALTRAIRWLRRKR
jgi:hypothetical protein